jgi:hypothetical protein
MAESAAAAEAEAAATGDAKDVAACAADEDSTGSIQREYILDYSPIPKELYFRRPLARKYLKALFHIERDSADREVRIAAKQRVDDAWKEYDTECTERGVFPHATSDHDVAEAEREHAAELKEAAEWRAVRQAEQIEDEEKELEDARARVAVEYAADAILAENPTPEMAKILAPWLAPELPPEAARNRERFGRIPLHLAQQAAVQRILDARNSKRAEARKREFVNELARMDAAAAVEEEKARRRRAQGLPSPSPSPPPSPPPAPAKRSTSALREGDRGPRAESLTPAAVAKPAGAWSDDDDDDDAAKQRASKKRGRVREERPPADIKPPKPPRTFNRGVRMPRRGARAEQLVELRDISATMPVTSDQLPYSPLLCAPVPRLATDPPVEYPRQQQQWAVGDAAAAVTITTGLGSALAQDLALQRAPAGQIAGSPLFAADAPPALHVLAHALLSPQADYVRLCAEGEEMRKAVHDFFASRKALYVRGADLQHHGQPSTAPRLLADTSRAYPSAAHASRWDGLDKQWRTFPRDVLEGMPASFGPPAPPAASTKRAQRAVPAAVGALDASYQPASLFPPPPAPSRRGRGGDDADVAEFLTRASQAERAYASALQEAVRGAMGAPSFACLGPECGGMRLYTAEQSNRLLRNTPAFANQYRSCTPDLARRDLRGETFWHLAVSAHGEYLRMATSRQVSPEAAAEFFAALRQPQQRGERVAAEARRKAAAELCAASSGYVHANFDMVSEVHEYASLVERLADPERGPSVRLHPYSPEYGAPFWLEGLQWLPSVERDGFEAPAFVAAVIARMVLLRLPNVNEIACLMEASHGPNALPGTIFSQSLPASDGAAWNDTPAAVVACEARMALANAWIAHCAVEALLGRVPGREDLRIEFRSGATDRRAARMLAWAEAFVRKYVYWRYTGIGAVRALASSVADWMFSPGQWNLLYRPLCITTHLPPPAGNARTIKWMEERARRQHRALPDEFAVINNSALTTTGQYLARVTKDSCAEMLDWHYVSIDPFYSVALTRYLEEIAHNRQLDGDDECLRHNIIQYPGSLLTLAVRRSFDAHIRAVRRGQFLDRREVQRAKQAQRAPRFMEDECMSAHLRVFDAFPECLVQGSHTFTLYYADPKSHLLALQTHALAAEQHGGIWCAEGETSSRSSAFEVGMRALPSPLLAPRSTELPAAAGGAAEAPRPLSLLILRDPSFYSQLYGQYAAFAFERHASFCAQPYGLTWDTDADRIEFASAVEESVHSSNYGGSGHSLFPWCPFFGAVVRDHASRANIWYPDTKLLTWPDPFAAAADAPAAGGGVATGTMEELARTHGGCARVVASAFLTLASYYVAVAPPLQLKLHQQYRADQWMFSREQITTLLFAFMRHCIEHDPFWLLQHNIPVRLPWQAIFFLRSRTVHEACARLLDALPSSSSTCAFMLCEHDRRWSPAFRPWLQQSAAAAGTGAAMLQPVAQLEEWLVSEIAKPFTRPVPQPTAPVPGLEDPEPPPPPPPPPPPAEPQPQLAPIQFEAAETYKRKRKREAAAERQRRCRERKRLAREAVSAADSAAM